MRQSVLRATAILALACVVCALAHAQTRPLWTEMYRPSADGPNQPAAIGRDGAANTIITGPSYGGATGMDWATVKYAPDGALLWVRRLDGPAHADDYANGLAVDQGGDIYVTGSVTTATATTSTTGLCETVKYGADGSVVWRRTYSGSPNSTGNAIALDAAGNVYVTGVVEDAGGGWSMVTIAYAPNGDRLWAKHYGSDRTIGRAIAIDSMGSVCVAGENNSAVIVLKYSSSGTLQWTASPSGIAYTGAGPGQLPLAIDGSDDIVVAGSAVVGENGTGTLYNYAVVRLSPEGAVVWKRRYAGPAGVGGDNEATGVAVDPSGDVIVTGMSAPFAGNAYDFDVATVKYSPSGQTLWVKRYGGSFGYSVGEVVLADSAGDVCVAAQLSTGYGLIQYDPTGNELGVRRFDGLNHDGGIPTAMVLDPSSGDIVLTGLAWESADTENPDSRCATVLFGPQP